MDGYVHVYKSRQMIQHNTIRWASERISPWTDVKFWFCLWRYFTVKTPWTMGHNCAALAALLTREKTAKSIDSLEAFVPSLSCSFTWDKSGAQQLHTKTLQGLWARNKTKQNKKKSVWKRIKDPLQGPRGTALLSESRKQALRSDESLAISWIRALHRDLSSMAAGDTLPSHRSSSIGAAHIQTEAVLSI